MSFVVVLEYGTLVIVDKGREMYHCEFLTVLTGTAAHKANAYIKSVCIDRRSKLLYSIIHVKSRARQRDKKPTKPTDGRQNEL